jgi:hypothetical protein
MNIRIYTISLCCLISFLVASPVFADSVSVTNSVSASVSTGGTDSSGTSHVFIETIVDGEVVEHIDETVTSDDASQNIHREVYVENDGGNTIVETTINLHAESDKSEEPTEVHAVVGPTISDFVPTTDDNVPAQTDDRVDDNVGDVVVPDSLLNKTPEDIQARSGSVVLATISSLFNFIIHVFNRFFI